MRYWAIYDVKDKDKQQPHKDGCFEVSESEAHYWNDKNYGIYFTPNSFNGARKEENLRKINFYFCDIDGGDKEEQMRRIRNTITPSVIVESKNGYHCYWKAKDATIEGFKEVERGIVKKLGADEHAVDLPRILRAPNFYHCKNPDEKFLVRVVSKTDREFSEDFMLFHFKLPPEPRFVYNYEPKDSDYMLNPDNWEKVFKISQIQEGSRNSLLKDQVYKAYMSGIRGTQLRELSLALNSRISRPLPVKEVLEMMRRLR